MNKIVLSCIMLLTGVAFCFGQNPCSYGPISEMIGIGENISTGGSLEYAGAADFDVPFGINFTVDQITFDAIKTEDEILYVNLAFLEEIEGLPGTSIQNFDNLIPTSQEFLYEAGDYDAYRVVLDLPTSLTFEKGKYFISLAANPGAGPFVAWDIAGEYQTYGVFDYNKFEDDDWGGTGYYNKTFEVIGTCEDSGEIQPNYGDACEQGNESNNREIGTGFLIGQQVASIADDFIVAENTSFYLTQFKLEALLLGGGFHNATIKIRTSENNAPGEVLYTYNKKGPAYEQFYGYFDYPGPFDLAGITVAFSFEDPIVLEEGTYFIEVTPTPYATEQLNWEATSLPGIGSDAYISYNEGTTWEIISGINQVFTVEGFCAQNLGIEDNTELTSINYYPNPVTNTLHISGNTEFKTVALYNILGVKVANYNTATNSIDTKTLDTGVYLVRTEFENGTIQINKVIKQ